MSNIISMDDARRRKKANRKKKVKSTDDKIKEALQKFGSHKEHKNNKIKKDDDK